MLGKYGLKAMRYGKHFNAVFFRRELPMLDDAIERSADIYTKIGAKWQDQKKTWRFPGGGRLRFRPLERTQDAEKYQGQNISDACVEEAGNYPEPAPIDRLNGVLRSAHGVPTQLILTGNPGGAGQLWIKARYIDPEPGGMRILRRKLPNGREHRYVFIPSRLQNNLALMRNDPEYINRLYLVGSQQLVQAWLDGDWNVIAGAFFSEFSAARHVIEPFEIPAHWVRIRACDWGSAKPFSVGWYAVSDGSIPGIQAGAMVKYREWYGVRIDETGNFVPNEGLKLTAEQVAQGIMKRQPADERIDSAVIDPSAFAENGGPSIAERMHRECPKITWRPADNTRVAQKGALGGWDQLRGRLVGTCQIDPETSRVDWSSGEPMLYFFRTCIHTIRTLPALQHDQSRAEDVDSDGEDHAPDETRYACSSRPWVRKPVVQEPTRFPVNRTINEMIAANARRKRASW